MKGDWPDFGGSSGDEFGADGAGGGFESGVDYNTAGSSSVGKVESVTTVSNEHSMPISSSPNSATRNYRDGKLSTERYYGRDGRPYLDIDYSDHGNPKAHPDVPHEHDIHFDESGKLRRGKGTKIK